MIVVIADDLTGAAELGGLGRRYGLATEITTSLTPVSAADLLIIATDTRSLSKEQAQAVVQEVSAGLEQLQPRLVFKKIDSVLRGHVLAEIQVQQAQLQLERALIVPANPQLGRTVVDGTYLLHGRPLHLSSFSQDPEFPVRSSRVPHMLCAGEGDIHVLKTHETMPEAGIIVGEVKDAADLAAWSSRIDNGTLVAGAAGFFAAILESLGIRPVSAAGNAAALQAPAFMICGSAFHKSRSFIKEMEQAGFPVSYMPAAVLAGDGPLFRQWMNEVLLHLERTGKAGIAVHPDIKDNEADALVVRTVMAEAAACIAGEARLNELLVEGGATAAAVIRRLDIETFYPVAELAPGVTRMRVKGRQGLFLTLKPGSYEWPPFYLQAKQAEDS